eukprot:4769272-Prymnesium_polylepis.1
MAVPVVSATVTKAAVPTDELVLAALGPWAARAEGVRGTDDDLRRSPASIAEGGIAARSSTAVSFRSERLLLPRGAAEVMGDDDAKAVKAELEFCKTQLEDDNVRADALIAFTKKDPVMRHSSRPLLDATAALASCPPTSRFPL